MRIRANIIICALLLAVWSCAKRGNPTGGPVDIAPPQLTRTVPPLNSTSIRPERITLYFDEFVKLKDLQQQLVISPPQENNPIIKPQAGPDKKVVIELQDTLKDNTTYVINFGQSIVDNNEDNPASGISYVFSTGTEIDSLELNGSVKDAFKNKTESFVKIMLHEVNENYSDSIVYKAKPDYVVTTLDSTTNFSFSNLRAGTYKLIAVKDRNNDLKVSPGDDVGFVSENVVLPTDQTYEIALFKPSPKPEFLQAFTTVNERIDLPYRGNIQGYDITTDPKLDRSRIIKSYKKDTLELWYRHGQKLDSIEVISKIDSREKSYTVKLSDKPTDSLTLLKTADVSLRSAAAYRASKPIGRIDNSRITVRRRDSTLVDFSIKIDSLNNEFSIDFPRIEKELYQVEIQDSAIVDMFGLYSKKIINAFSTSARSSYASIQLNLKNVRETPIIVQVVNENLEVQNEKIVTGDGRVSFEFLDPGSYLIRTIEDRNSNGRYDAGDFIAGIQPEKVRYPTALIKLAANRDAIETVILE